MNIVKDLNYDNPTEVMATFEASGGGETEERANRRYEATYKLEVALIDAIGKLSPYPTFGVARDLLREWLSGEDGELALDRLVTMVIH